MISFYLYIFFYFGPQNYCDANLHTKRQAHWTFIGFCIILDMQLFPTAIQTKFSPRRDKMQMLVWLHRKWWRALCGVSMLFHLLGTWESLSPYYSQLVAIRLSSEQWWLRSSAEKERDAAPVFVFSLSSHYATAWATFAFSRPSSGVGAYKSVSPYLAFDIIGGK